jgi:hypothetical protein
MLMSESGNRSRDRFRAVLRRQALSRFVERYGIGAKAVFATFDDPVIQRIMNEASEFRKIAVFSALKTAGKLIRDHHACDFCKLPAGFIRVCLTEPDQIPTGLGAPAGAHGLGIYIVCPVHHVCQPVEFDHLVLDRLSKYAASGERVFFARPVIIGPRVGTASKLSRGAILSTCKHCSADIWVAPKVLDDTSEGDGEPLFMCWDCAYKNPFEGRGGAGE